MEQPRASIEATDQEAYDRKIASETNSIEEFTQEGVIKAEKARAVWGLRGSIALWIGVGLSSFMYTLDNGTNYQWGSYATTQFNNYPAYAAIQCASSILLALGKPLFAKIMDSLGRAEAYCFSLFFYLLGYIIAAASPDITALGAGLVIWVIGFSGLQIANQIIIADFTTLRWRGLVQSLTSAWYFILFWANGKITQQLVAPGGPGWRWGYGIYALCYIPALGPIILTLLWGQYRAKKLGLVEQPRAAAQRRSRLSGAWKWIQESDLIGLFWLGASITLIFLPLVLAGGSYATLSWQSPTIPAMMVIGGAVALPIFIYWELKRALFPIIPFRLLKNRTVLAACLISFFDFISFYLTYAQLYGFVAATTNWSLSDITYYTNCQSLCLTFFALLWGAVAIVLKFRYKWTLTAALCVRLIGIGLMFYAREHNSTAALVMTQVIQGAGGGVAAIASQVGSQGAVPHQDVAVATAVVLLSAELGNVVGSAAAGAIWRSALPEQLTNALADVGFTNTTYITMQVGNPLLAQTSFPDLSDPIREAIHSGYSSTMRLMLIPAIVLSVIPIIASVFMRDFHLVDLQNVVEAKDLQGNKVAGGDLETIESGKV
ncbi:MFS general substrate transporter [Dacryopinax primogenitus]|uniref:MFS general substrate transporter n=1 Tax=Dacryopinax primogenitus (strain DJM 731) TaxID=1858805 RepID=M5FT03_DACPD|nr:MFS general substrate transporter [Dacryopinax primogenitus]EJT98469.1 MFS general substrate transporter [Dacryopinax primogenitus]